MKKINIISISGLWLFSILLSPVASVAQKASDTSYHLLWYKGKEIKPNVLQTPQGDIVTYDPSKGTVKMESKSGTGKELDNMLAEVNKTTQRINEMMQRLAGIVPKPAVPYYAKPVQESFNELQQEFSNALSNLLQIPEFSAPNSPAKGKGPSFFMDNTDDDPTAKAIAEALAYMEQHKNDNPEIPVPPQRDYSYCYACDKAKQEGYRKALEEFNKKITGEDGRIMQLILSVERHWAIMNTEKYMEVSNQLKPVFDFLLKRFGEKGRMLIEKYADDPEHCTAAVQAALSIERSKQILGSADDKESSVVMNSLERIKKTITDKITKAISEYDYSIALNIQLIVGAERQLQILGKASDDNNLIEKAVRFNNFKLNIKVSGKIAGDGAYQLAELKGDNYFAAVPDKDCRLHWALIKPNEKNMKFDLLKAEMRGKGHEIPYVGTKKWNSAPPKMRIDFCNYGDDSVEVYGFLPEGFQEMWEFPPPTGSMNIGMMSNVLIGCFMDIERIRKEANMANAEKKKKEMMEQYQQFMKNRSAGQGSPEAMAKFAESISNSSKINELVHSNAIGSFLIKPSVQNNSQIIFKKRLNGQELFPQNTATEYAWFDITLEQDPGGQ